MSTSVFVDLEISTQADGAQSSRVPVPFPEDPYEAIRQVYLVETDTPESPHTVSSPTSLLDSTPPTRSAKDSVDSDTSGARSTPSDSTAPLSPDHPLTHATPTLVHILRKTIRMAVCVSPTMSSGLSASIAEMAAMSDSAFQDEEEEDEEIDERLDSDRDEGLAAGDEGRSMRVESLGLGGDAAVPKGQKQAALVIETVVSEPLELGYGALRRWEIALGKGRMPSVFEVGQGSRFVLEPKRLERVSALRQPILTIWIDPEDGITYINVPAYPPPAPHVQTSPSPEWSSGSLSVSLAPSIVPSPVSSPMIPLTVPSHVASHITTETKGFLTKLGPRVEMHEGLIHDHMIAEERHARLDMVEIVNSMKRGQDPRGDV
nr:hypothetical protein [Tanacetum cinerariifolium]